MSWGSADYTRLGIKIGAVLAVLLFLSIITDSGSGTTTEAAAAVTVSDARAKVDSLLLGENWTGSGSYTVVAAKVARSGGASLYAAKIDAPGASGCVCSGWIRA